jgi:hypothetical protein
LPYNLFLERRCSRDRELLVDYLTLLALAARLLVLLAHTNTLNNTIPSLGKVLLLCRSCLCRCRQYDYRVSFFNVKVFIVVLYDFRCARDDRLVAKLLELAWDRAEDAACLWLLFLPCTFDDHYCVFIEADIRTVFAAERLALAHNNTAEHVLLLNLPCEAQQLVPKE